ncbi:MAG: hypothetical protein E7270_03560 [Lachnospiraceae bacterium]|nr:hypothetical protein [Lachnospiraceae bacterium]
MKEFKKLEKNALGCMYISTGLSSVIVMAILTIGLIYFGLYKETLLLGIYIGVMALIALNAIISPLFRYHRYRYYLDSTSIETISGYIFVKHRIVPIERIQNVSISEGPIDRKFGVGKVTIVTGGGDIDISNISKNIADEICEMLKNKINDIVIEGRCEDGQNI